MKGDYDAIGWTCKVDRQGQFRLAIDELKPGDHELRLTVYGASGDSRRFVFGYQVDRTKGPDLTAFEKFEGTK